MQFLTRIARTIEQLDRVAQRYQDEELKTAINELYKQLAVVINIVEKIYAIYTELDILVKTDLKIEPGLFLEVEPPQQQEKLADYLERVKTSGAEPTKILAYLLGTGQATLEIHAGEIYIKPRQNQRY